MWKPIVIQVLELNDDNHSCCYASKDGFWYDAQNFGHKFFCIIPKAIF